MRSVRTLTVLVHPHAILCRALDCFLPSTALESLSLTILTHAVTQTLAPTDKGTWLTRMIAQIRENPWVVGVIAIAGVVLAVARFAKEIKELFRFLFSNSKEAARLKLARLSLDYTADSFVQSAQRGDIHAVEAYLAAGIDPNQRNHLDYTALRHAVERSDTRMVRSLLRAGADVAVINQSRTALDCGVDGSAEVMRLLLAKAPRADIVDSAFVTAAAYGNTEILSLLKEYGANVTKVGQQALTLAARLCHDPERLCKNVSYLLELGIDPNSRDEDGYTPLHGAVSRG